MNSAGLVAIALLCGIMLVVVLGGMAFLCYLLMRAIRLLNETKQQSDDLARRMDFEMQQFLSEVREQNSFLLEEQDRQDHERAATMTGLSSSLGQFRSEVRTMLETHRAGMDEKLTALNGPALQRAAVQIVTVTRELAQVAGLLREMVVNQEESVESGLGPEDYAKPNGSSIYQSETAYSDAQVEQFGTEAAEQEGPATRIHEATGILS